MTTGKGFPPYLDPNLQLPYSPVVLAVRSSLSYPDCTKYSDQQWPVVTAPANAAIVPAQLTTVDGWAVDTGFVAGTGKTIAPNYGIAPRGLWGSLTMWAPTLATIVGTAAITVLGAVQLDTTLYAVMYSDATNAFAVVIDVSSGLAGTPGTLGTHTGASPLGAAIFKESTTSYMACWRHQPTNHSFRIGTVTPATLAIAQGVVAVTAVALNDAPVQVATGVYTFVQSNASALRAAVTSGTTTVTIGTAAASGSFDDTTDSSSIRVCKSNTANEFLCAMLQVGGGTASTRQMGVRTGSINTSTGALTLNAITSAATNICQSSGLRVLSSPAAGAAIIVAQNGSTGTSGNFYAATVAASVPSISAVTVRTTDLPASNVNYGTWVYKKGGAATELYDSQTVVFGHLATGIYVAQVTGVATLTFGATLAFASAKTFLKDANGVGEVFATSTGVFDKLSLAGTTLSSVLSASGITAPSVIKSQEFGDTFVRNSGTFYPWTPPTVAAVVRNDIWLVNSGNNLLLMGPVS